MTAPHRIIIDRTAAEYGLSGDELIGVLRTRFRRWVRFDAMSRIRAVMRPDGRHRYSTTQIAALFGLRDHTTVVSGLRQWERLEESGVQLRDWYAPSNDKIDPAWFDALKLSRFVHSHHESVEGRSSSVYLLRNAVFYTA